MRIAAYDIGGTALKMGVLNEKGEILAQEKTAVPNFSGEHILASIQAWLASHSECDGIALSVPGYVDPWTGFITMGGSLRDFDGFALQAWLQNKTGLPVSVENDANCALLAERWLGNAQTMRDFLMMTIGTGIGGALFCNGELVRGHRFRAGEFGYLLSERPGAGRLNSYTMNENCTLAVLRRRYSLISDRPLETVTGEEIFAGYDQGNKICVRLVTQFYQDLCSGIYNLAHLFDPECVFLGGGITERPGFIDEIKAHLAWYGLTVPVARASHGNSAGLTGAVYHYLNSRHK